MDYENVNKSCLLDSKTTDLNSTLWKFQLTPEGTPDYSQLSSIVRDFPHGYYPSYEFEKSSLDFGRVLEFMHENWWIPFSAGTLYLVVIFALQEFMKGRKALELKWPLFTWNLTIGLFSLVGFLRTAPDLIYILQGTNGMHDAVCTVSLFSPRFAFWGILFAISKVAELGNKN
jgi:elongation of very long chain fatty acids protein 6